MGQPLLDVPTSWHLFARGDDVVRLDLKAGRVTVTSRPALQSSRPVYFVVGGDRAIVRPLDLVTGYVLFDGRPAQPLAGVAGTAAAGTWSLVADDGTSVGDATLELCLR